jgi:histidine phosphotransfer protein HptB
VSDHIDDEILQGLRDIMEEGFTELLEVFLRESSTQHRQLQQMWSTGERQSLGQLAHSLKGSCANIGAKTCARIASEVERHVQHEMWDELPSLLTALEREMQFAHGELSRLC